jgi:hypothetical protein
MEINDLRDFGRPRSGLWPWRAEDKSQNIFATKDSKDKRKEASFFVPFAGFLRPVHFWLCPATFPSCLPSAKCQRTGAWAPHIFHTTTIRREHKDNYSTVFSVGGIFCFFDGSFSRRDAEGAEVKMEIGSTLIFTPQQYTSSDWEMGLMRL